MTRAGYNNVQQGHNNLPQDHYYGQQINNETWPRGPPINNADKSNLSKDWTGSDIPPVYSDGYYPEKSYYDSSAYASKTDKVYYGASSVKKNYLPGKDYYDQSLYNQKQRNEQYYERNQLPSSYPNNATDQSHRSYNNTTDQSQRPYRDEQ